jgi:hypothetical protein
MEVIVLLKHAKAAARQWVIAEGATIPGFAGAFYHGSTNWLPDDADLPATSDVDIMVVLADSEPPVKLGKFVYQDVLLEVSYLPQDQLQEPAQILSNSHMAGSFRNPGIIADPSGTLTTLQIAVAKDYAKRHWVTKRCEHARDKALNNLQALNASDPFHDQVAVWLFATGVMTHVLLAAGLKNPTVRQRYVATRALLTDYGHLDFYETLLDLLGCAQISRARVEQHLAALAEVFDVTKTVIKTPFFFASDLSDSARPIVIDGSRTLIEEGLHREAIFWMVATYSRCQKVLHHDASIELQEQFDSGYRRLLVDLGVTSFADLQRRGEQVRRVLPLVWEVAEAIMVANSEIE